MVATAITLSPWCCGQPWKGAKKGMMLSGCLLWQWWQACQSLAWARWPSPAMYQLLLLLLFLPRYSIPKGMKKITLCNTCNQQSLLTQAGAITQWLSAQTFTREKTNLGCTYPSRLPCCQQATRLPHSLGVGRRRRRWAERLFTVKRKNTRQRRHLIDYGDAVGRGAYVTDGESSSSSLCVQQKVVKR